MASPASSVGEHQPKKKHLEQITFRFCSECSNMLYPKEDPQTHKLNFACRTCQYSEEAVSSCVFRNVLNNAVGETAGVTQDVGSDPTVGCPGFCTLCGCEITCVVCGEVDASTGDIYMDDEGLADDEEETQRQEAQAERK